MLAQKRMETVARGDELLTTVREVHRDGTETVRCISAIRKPVELRLVEDDRGHEMVLNRR